LRGREGHLRGEEEEEKRDAPGSADVRDPQEPRRRQRQVLPEHDAAVREEVLGGEQRHQPQRDEQREVRHGTASLGERPARESKAV
jgi:hypothetical protein